VVKEETQPKLDSRIGLISKKRAKRKLTEKSYMIGKAFFQKGFGDFDGFVRR
jgi:hypothetical protein